MDTNHQYRIRFYVGCKVGGVQKHTPEDIARSAGKCLWSDVQGFTVYPAYGSWHGVIELSAVIEVLTPNLRNPDDYAIETAAFNMATLFDQSEVLYTIESVEVGSVERIPEEL